jgi:hypothetical protein
MLISHKYKFIFLKNTKTGSSSVQTLLGKYCWPDEHEYMYKVILTGKLQLESSDHDHMCGDFKKRPEQEIVDYFNTHRINSNGIIGAGDKTQWRSHMSAQEVRDNIGEDVFKNYHKISIVRNPYTKILSKYFWEMNDHHGITVDEWLDLDRDALNLHIHCIPGCSVNGTPACDTYIKYENLHAELKDICLKIGINDLDLNHLPNNKALNSKQPMDKMDKFGIKNMYIEFKSSLDSWKHILSEKTKSRIYEKHKREFELFDYSND